MPRPTGRPEEVAGYQFAELKNVGDNVEGRFSYEVSPDPEEGLMFFLTNDEGQKTRLPSHVDLKRKLMTVAARMQRSPKKFWVHIALKDISESNKARTYEVSTWEE